MFLNYNSESFRVRVHNTHAFSLSLALSLSLSLFLLSLSFSLSLSLSLSLPPSVPPSLSLSLSLSLRNQYCYRNGSIYIAGEPEWVVTTSESVMERELRTRTFITQGLRERERETERERTSKLSSKFPASLCIGCILSRFPHKHPCKPRKQEKKK